MVIVREAVGGINGMGNAVIGRESWNELPWLRFLIHIFVIVCETLCMEMGFVRSYWQRLVEAPRTDSWLGLFSFSLSSKIRSVTRV